jgi:hypothetical protein
MDVTDLRHADRFVTREPLTGSFGATAVTIANLADQGAQVRHAQALRLGTKARFWFRHGAMQVVAQAIVVWSRLNKHMSMDGRVIFDTGLRVEEGAEEFADGVRKLVDGGVLRPDVAALDRKRRMQEEKEARRWGRPILKRLKQTTPEVSPEQVMLIQHARERMSANPDEARKWFQRAKFSLPEDRRVERINFREDVLAVWEYLERTVEISAIEKVFDKKV